MNKKIIAIAILLIISVVTISGCAQQKPTDNPTSPVTGPSAKSCSVPSDCGSFYDCINSKCVKIMPPTLP